MSNPWLKKNPFMSLWLSTANRVAGSLRGQATAQFKRQANAAVSEASRVDPKLGPKAVKAAPARRKR